MIPEQCEFCGGDHPNCFRVEPPQRPGGPWTRHGHAISGVTVAGTGRPPVARCGGPTLCTSCALDAERLRATP